MPKSVCDICEVEWDPEIQAHHRGHDCVAPLAERVKGFHTLVARMEKAHETLYNTHTDIEEKGFKHIAGLIGEARAEIAALIKRIENLEKKKGS